MMNFIKREKILVGVLLSIISIIASFYFYYNGLSIAYNDARSHLDIGRRVVEGLKPGLAQLGSVWLPLPHLLMIPTIWNDFMWHSGLSGTLISMISFIFCGVLIYSFLDLLKVNRLGKFVGVFIFATNLNVLYLQSTAMTELLLLFTMTAGVYELALWHKTENIYNLIKSAFFIMLSTLTRYDGWFLLAFSLALIIIHTLKQKKNNYTEGIFILFFTLAGFGIGLWFLWNQLIFKDALYFIFGPFSAKAQQDLLLNAGVLATKDNLFLSIKVYLYALTYNSNAFVVIVGFLGFIKLMLDKKINTPIKIALSALFAPLLFNIIALFMGHSVLYVQGLSGNTWFNVRYGIMMIPTIAIFSGYLIDRLKIIKIVLIGFIIFTTFFSIINNDAVTVDDARVGSSQKNVTEVSNWLKANAQNSNDYILISAASHDAIIFSSGLPMKDFIHEGTGKYWDNAIEYPDRWAKWIIMRTYDLNDLTYKLIKDSNGFQKYKLVGKFPFADIYELKPEYMNNLSKN